MKIKEIMKSRSLKNLKKKNNLLEKRAEYTAIAF